MANIADALERKKQKSPQYDYMWRVELPTLTQSGIPEDLAAQSLSATALFGDNIEILNGSNGDDMEELNHRVTNIEVPFDTYDTMKNPKAGSYWYGASHKDIGQITLTMHEMEDGLTLKYFNDWQKLISNNDGTHNPPVIFKRNLRVIKLSQTGHDIHYSLYKGYFPSEISQISYDYESNDISQVSVTLTGDSVENHFIPVSRVNVLIQENQDSIMLQDQRGMFDLNVTEDKLAAVSSLINRGVTLF